MLHETINMSINISQIVSWCLLHAIALLKGDDRHAKDNCLRTNGKCFCFAKKILVNFVDFRIKNLWSNSFDDDRILLVVHKLWSSLSVDITTANHLAIWRKSSNRDFLIVYKRFSVPLSREFHKHKHKYETLRSSRSSIRHGSAGLLMFRPISNNFSAHLSAKWVAASLFISPRYCLIARKLDLPLVSLLPINETRLN